MSEELGRGTQRPSPSTTRQGFCFGPILGGQEERVRRLLSWYTVGVLSFLLVFTVVFSVSHWRILCYPGLKKRLRAAMTKITLKNDLEGKEVKIREGNAGCTRELCTLKPGRTYDIHKDPNATYREYIFITLPDNTKLRVLTSDDFDNFKKISIYEEDGRYNWMDTAERNSAPGNTAQVGLFKRLLRSIGFP